MPDRRGVVDPCRARRAARARSTRSWPRCPFRRRVERHDAAPVDGAGRPCRRAAARHTASTQEAFGRIMGELARSDLPLAARIVTTSPDVTVSTSLGGWVGRREVFGRRDHEDVFRAEQVLSPTPWRESRTGPAPRARHRREQPVPQPRQPRPRARAVRRPPAAGRHALRPVHRPRPRCAELRLLPGRALPAGGDAVGHHAGARGRRAPVDRHAADRHQPAGPDLVRAGLRRRGRGHAALGVRAPAGAGRRLGLPAPDHPPAAPAASAR